MGEKAISVSDRKQVKIEGVFEESDLLSEEEKAAMAEDLSEQEAEEKARQAAGEGEDDADAIVAKAKADAEAAAEAKKAREDADAKKAKEIEEADAEIAAKKAKDDEDAKAAAAGEDKGDKGGEAKAATPAPGSQPPLVMQTMTAEQVKGLKDSLEENEKKFQDGEVNYKEYFDARLEIERQLWQNDLAAQLSETGVEAQWQWEQSSFLGSEDNAWINDDDVVYSAFAATVNRIMSSEEGAVMPGPDLLAKARDEVAARFSPDKAADDAAAQEKKDKEAALKGAKKAQGNKDLPLTLGEVPAAEDEEGGGEFGWIDKLDGEAYEKAVEGLSEAQLSRYADSR